MNKQPVLFFLVSFLILSSYSYSHQPVTDTIPSIHLNKALPEVIVKRNRLPVRIHGDTLGFDASRYADAHTTKLQDLLKKMPGFRVDEGGRIFFHGKEISKILVDGDDLAGHRYATLSKNLRASLVKELQVVQHFQENRLMKGHVDSDAVALNLNIHEKYSGRPTGNLFATANLVSHGAVNGDLLNLHRKAKQLLFLDKNNVGDAGLVVDDNRILQQEVVENKNDHRSWPFDDQGEQRYSNIPSGYANNNDDHGVMLLTTNAIGRCMKLRSETNIGKESLFRFSSNTQLLRIPSTQPVQVFSSSLKQTNSSSASIKLVLDRDDDRRRISRYQLIASSESVNGIVSENRMLHDHYLRKFNQHHRAYRIAMHQHETWQLGKKGLLLIENSVVADKNRQSLIIDDPLFFLSPYASGPYSDDQLLTHNGAFLNTHIGSILTFPKTSIRFGVRTAFYSSNEVFDQQKRYVYFGLTRKHVFKAAQELQVAIGTAASGRSNADPSNQLIYRLEHTLTWQITQLNKISVGFKVDRTASDLKVFHAGPLFLHNGLFAASPEGFVHPAAAEFHIDFTKMDLYSGLTAMLSINLRQVKNELGVGSLVMPSYVSTGYFIISDQKNLSVISNLEKFIFPVKMKYAFSGSLILMNTPQQLNTQMMRALVYTLGLEHRFISNWKGLFNLELFYGNNLSRFSSLSGRSPASRFCRYHYAVHTILRINNRFSGVLNYSALQTGGQNHFHMLDLRMKAKISSVWTASLTLSNLLNNTYYRERTAGLYTSQVNEFQVNGRRLLFGINYTF